MTIIAAADGSALGNPGPAGWAWFIDETSWGAGGWAHGTNNMGELTAVLNLLESTRHCAHEPLTILCDSQYVINSVTKWLPGWKKKGWKKRDGTPVLNVDIMKALNRELTGRTVEFEWVKGHAGHHLNEAADERARAMATAFQAKRPPEDLPTGPGFRGSASDHEAAAAAATASEPALEPDLFSELLALEQEREDVRVAEDPDPRRALWEREGRLLHPATSDGVRADLLHEDFEYIGADGTTHPPGRFTTERVGNARAGENPEMEPGSVVDLGSTACHLSYRLVGASGATRRSSLWVRQDHHNEMGPWLLRFHQVTPEG